MAFTLLETGRLEKPETATFCFSSVVVSWEKVLVTLMADEYYEPTTPAWMETSALTAPALLGAAAGLLLGDLMHRGARRGVGIGLGALGVAALLPFVVGGVTGLVTGPRSKFGVKKNIQRIRDAGIVSRDYDGDYDEVDQELREQGLL